MATHSCPFKATSDNWPASKRDEPTRLQPPRCDRLSPAAFMRLRGNTRVTAAGAGARSWEACNSAEPERFAPLRHTPECESLTHHGQPDRGRPTQDLWRIDLCSLIPGRPGRGRSDDRVDYRKPAGMGAGVERVWSKVCVGLRAQCCYQHDCLWRGVCRRRRSAARPFPPKARMASGPLCHRPDFCLPDRERLSNPRFLPLCRPLQRRFRLQCLVSCSDCQYWTGFVPGNHGPRMERGFPRFLRIPAGDQEAFAPQVDLLGGKAKSSRPINSVAALL
jgi:hypothetical protein